MGGTGVEVRYELNPSRYGRMPVEKGIVMGVWYLICKSRCGDNYHNLTALGSKLWCLHVNYKTKDHARLLQKTSEYVLNCRRLFHKFLEGKELKPNELEMAMKYDLYDAHMLHAGQCQRKPKLP